MRLIYQFCETCKTETNFKYDTVTCTKCGNVCKNYISKEKTKK